MVIAARSLVSAALLAALALPAQVAAEPYRLRADVFAQAPSTEGFVMVQAEARERGPWLVDAEALVWTGAGLDARDAAEARGEAVIASVRLRDAERRTELRFGRLLFAGGAIRPLHLDGAVTTFRSPTGAALELFGGLPVAPGNDGRSFDWLLGGRTTQAIGEVGRVGLSYFQQRDEGKLARTELGVEGAVTPTDALAVTATMAVDTLRTGVAEARVSTLVHDGRDRLEVFGLHRSPGRLLPATSLFAAIGSYDANGVGLSGSLRAAPRLDLYAMATLDEVAQRAGATQLARAELRLDDEGRGAIGVEGRRVSIPDASWTGARAWLRLPIVSILSASTELELAVPDDGGDRGALWPWGLVALRCVPVEWLEASAAVEASASPSYTSSVGGLFRLSGRWGRP